MERRSGFVALALESGEEENLWSGIFATQGMHAIAITPEGGPRALGADPRLAQCAALVADAPALLAGGIAPAQLASALRDHGRDLAYYVRLPERAGISAPERAWASGVGITSLLPGSTVAAWQSSLEPVLGRVLAGIGCPVDTDALATHLRSLVNRGAEPRPGTLKDIYADSNRLEMRGLNAVRLGEAMQDRGGVEVADRTYRGKTYRQCFVASEAIDWIEEAAGVERDLAIAACAFLWRTGRIHHVLREAPFADDYLFFRFAGRRADVESLDLLEMQESMRAFGGVSIADRTYLGKRYPRCFVGSDCVDWMMLRYALPLGAAESLGQRLLELGVFHHVLDQHGFVDGNLYYRFLADETAHT